MANFQIILKNQIKKELELLSGWKIENDKLKTSYFFKDFKTAFIFMTLVAFEAEKLKHHPTWTNTYNQVNISFSTHDARNKITNLDIKMARCVSKIAKSFFNS